MGGPCHRVECVQSYRASIRRSCAHSATTRACPIWPGRYRRPFHRRKGQGPISLAARAPPTIPTGSIGQAQAPPVALRLAGGVEDQGDGSALEVDDLAEVEDDVEVALGVDEIAQDGIDARPVVEADLTTDGDDHGPSRPADAQA